MRTGWPSTATTAWSCRSRLNEFAGTSGGGEISGITVGPGDIVYASLDYESGYLIEAWQKSGGTWSMVDSFAGFGSGAYELRKPKVLAASADGRVWVCDGNNDRIAVWQEVSGSWACVAAGGMFADATLVTVMNHTDCTWNMRVATNAYAWATSRLESGKESRWNSGVSDMWFGTETSVSLKRLEWAVVHEVSLMVVNPEIGSPSARLLVKESWDGKRWLVGEDFSEGRLVRAQTDTLTFYVHRWDDGEETFDEDAEEYRRWVLRLVQR